MNRLTLLPWVLLLSSCAGNRPPAVANPAKDAADPAGLICTTETHTGSVLPTKVCKTPEQIAAEKASADRNLDEQRRTQRTQAR